MFAVFDGSCLPAQSDGCVSITWCSLHAMDWLVFFDNVLCSQSVVALCHEYYERVCFILFCVMTRSSASYSFDAWILPHKVGQIIVTRQKSFLIRINYKKCVIFDKGRNEWSLVVWHTHRSSTTEIHKVHIIYGVTWSLQYLWEVLTASAAELAGGRLWTGSSTQRAMELTWPLPSNPWSPGGPGDRFTSTSVPDHIRLEHRRITDKAGNSLITRPCH